ncbi:MAG: DMT family transporter [Hyphomicrobiaceae bacterium]|nr:DMT family transporter [Hyphomicrobiaceae bacterium]
MADRPETAEPAAQTDRAAPPSSATLLVAIGWTTLAMALLALLQALGRHAALEGMDPMQVLFFRNLFCVLFMLPLFVVRGMSLVRTDQLPLYGTRVAVSFVSMMAMFHAIALIPIGEVTAIGFLSPVLGTLFAIILLGEVVRIRRWLALLAGLGGALIIIAPTLGGGASASVGWGQAFALVSAFAIGIIGPLVKKLTLKDDPDRIVFVTNVLLTPLSLVPALFVWQWPPLAEFPVLAAMGLVAVTGHMALVRAYAYSDASLVMTYKFVRLPFAVIIGWLAFGETIGWSTWAGGLIIFAAAAYITHRERLVARSQTGVPPLAAP